MLNVEFGVRLGQLNQGQETGDSLGLALGWLHYITDGYVYL